MRTPWPLASLNHRERRVVDRFGRVLGHETLQIGDQAVLVLMHDLRLAALVLEGDLESLVQVTGNFEPLGEAGWDRIAPSGRSSDPAGRTPWCPSPRALPSFLTAPTGLPCLKRCRH